MNKLGEVIKFVQDHEAFLNYVLQFGTAGQRARAATLIEIAAGGLE